MTKETLNDFDKHLSEVVDFLNQYCTENEISYQELEGILVATWKHYEGVRNQPRLEKYTKKFLEENKEFLLSLHE